NARKIGLGSAVAGVPYFAQGARDESDRALGFHFPEAPFVARCVRRLPRHVSAPRPLPLLRTARPRDGVLVSLLLGKDPGGSPRPRGTCLTSPPAPRRGVGRRRLDRGGKLRRRGDDRTVVRRDERRTGRSRRQTERRGRHRAPLWHPAAARREQRWR